MTKFESFIILLSFTSFSCEAQYNKLFDFNYDTIGGNPYASLYQFGSKFYGTTIIGGINGGGTLFSINPDGTGHCVLFNFAGSTTGQYPLGNVTTDGTTLYGTTQAGGIGPCSPNCGTIFKIEPDGSGFSKIFDFAGTTTGSQPSGSLYYDGIYLYGLSYSGGQNDLGTIFKVKTDGSSFIDLLDFSGTNDGGHPYGSLISYDSLLFGMTSTGGTYDLGTIFCIHPDGTGFNKLLDFAGAANGSTPCGSLISDGTFLYGMTMKGGLNDLGTLFRIKPDGTAYMKLLDFTASNNGAWPTGDLLLKGMYLYGATPYGGTYGLGTVFKIMTDGSNFSILHNFYSSSGSRTYGSLVADSSYLYGLTYYGGNNGYGAMYRYADLGMGFYETPPDNTTILYPNPNDGTLNIVLKDQECGTLELFDMNGKLLFGQHVSQSEQIDLAGNGLPDGIYLFKFSNTNESQYGKVVIHHE